MAMIMNFEYVHFVLSGTKPKTSIWQCLNNKSGDILGRVRWQAQWRQYVFYPEIDTIFSADCLHDIHTFIRGAMAAHKQQKGH